MQLDINKLALVEKSLIERTMTAYLKSWFKKPLDIDADNLNIERIRYVQQWGTKTEPEDGFIVEFRTEENRHRELLGRSELGLSVNEFKEKLNVQQKNGIGFGKLFVTNQTWYEYPVVWGVLDQLFDEERDYTGNGIFSGDDYLRFGGKYD